MTSIFKEKLDEFKEKLKPEPPPTTSTRITHRTDPRRAGSPRADARGYFALCGPWMTDYPAPRHERPTCPDCLRIIERNREAEETRRQLSRNRVM